MEWDPLHRPAGMIRELRHMAPGQTSGEGNFCAPSGAANGFCTGVEVAKVGNMPKECQPRRKRNCDCCSHFRATATALSDPVVLDVGGHPHRVDPRQGGPASTQFLCLDQTGWTPFFLGCPLFPGPYVAGQNFVCFVCFLFVLFCQLVCLFVCLSLS